MSKQQEGSHRKPGRVLTKHKSASTLILDFKHQEINCCYLASLSVAFCYGSLTLSAESNPLLHWITFASSHHPLNGTHLDVHVLPQG